jgi:cell division protein FtsB
MEIRKIKQTIQHEQAAATQAIRTLESLENPDSLERFAREQYNMHADGEDVYIITD